MSVRRIREYLDGNKARYARLPHSPAHTASEVAQAVHIPGREVVKTVVLKIDGRMALAVVPSTHDVDLDRVKEVLGAMSVALATEGEFADRFQGSQLGAMPPFGNLYGMGTIVDRSLAKEKFIAFNAGTHTDVFAMPFADYRRLAHPLLARIEMEKMNDLHTAQI